MSFCHFKLLVCDDVNAELWVHIIHAHEGITENKRLKVDTLSFCENNQ